MTTFEAYKLYLALRLHFTSDGYDIRKTKGRIRASEQSLQKNVKLQYALQKLKTKYTEQQFINFLVANFISGDKWGGLFDPQSEDIYLSWVRKYERLSYEYSQELQTFADLGFTSVEKLWEYTGDHPPILKMYFGKKCSLETLVILNKLYKFIDILDEQLVFDPVWNTVSKLIYKYSPFIKIEREKYQLMTNKVF